MCQQDVRRLLENSHTTLLSLDPDPVVGCGLRRFSLHIEPRGFIRIRHYGILSRMLKKVCVELLQQERGRIKLPECRDVHLLCPASAKDSW